MAQQPTRQRVLLVEDSATQALLAAHVLRAAGFDVEHVKNGREALEEVRRRPPDVLVSDVLMPVMDGFALCREVRRDPALAAMPIVLHTSTFDDPKDAEFALSLGATAFLRKPTDPAEMVAHVYNAIALQQSRREASAPAMPDDSAFVKGYSERVATRLEQQVTELEQTNRQLHQQNLELVATRDQLQVLLTERQRAEEQARFLAEVSDVLAGSLDQPTIAAQLARLVVRRYADWCLVDRIEDDRTIHRTAAHAGAVRQPDDALEGRMLPDLEGTQLVARVLRTGRPELVSRLLDPADLALGADPEQLEALRAAKLHSAMVVPLAARGQLFGALSFAVSSGSRGYEPADLQLVTEVARRAAQAIDNARLYHAAQEAVRLQDEFLLIAAHELRTPVTSLLAYSQLLQQTSDEQAGNGRGERIRRVIGEQTERLAKLVEVLVDLSRIEAGQLTLEHRLLELRDLVREGVEQFQQMLPFRSRQHRVELSCVDAPVVVNGDTTRLAQVLSNLLTNAIKYSPEGGTITVRVERQAEQAVLTVGDQGIGIPAAAQPQLFQRFYRASNAALQHIAGFGIGLYVAYQIVTRHGGTIEVASQEGEGSTFSVRLPLVQTS